MCATFYSPRIISDGLVLYLDAGNRKSYPGSGTVWTEILGTGNTGTLTNGPTFDSNNGGSITFDGVNDYVNMSSVTITAFPFTISIFAKTSSTAATARNLFGNGNTSTTGEFIQLQFNALNQVAFIVRTVDASRQNAADASAGFNDGKWHLFTGVANAFNSIFSYVDGTLVASGANNGGTNWGFPTLNTQTVGAVSRTSLANYFPGNIASTQIYNRALSATEILQNYNATRSRFGV